MKTIPKSHFTPRPRLLTSNAPKKYAPWGMLLCYSVRGGGVDRRWRAQSSPGVPQPGARGRSRLWRQSRRSMWQLCGGGGACDADRSSHTRIPPKRTPGRGDLVWCSPKWASATSRHDPLSSTGLKLPPSGEIHEMHRPHNGFTRMGWFSVVNGTWCDCWGFERGGG